MFSGGRYIGSFVGRCSFRRPRRILIAGASPAGRALAAGIQACRPLNAEVAGFLDDEAEGPEILGRLVDFEAVARRHHVTCLAVALPPEEQQKWIRPFWGAFRHLLLLNTDSFSERLQSRQLRVGSFMLHEVGNRLKMPVYRAAKRLSDMLLACFAIVLSLPVCLLIAIVIRLTSCGSVFYRARRLGYNGVPFQILKFRTMRQDADAMLEQLLEEDPTIRQEWEERFKLKKDPRVTAFGNFLRKSSLDELPQLWNVLRGDMAVIGPRPIVHQEKHFYGDDFFVFSQVKPGMTGLWQVSGRSNTTYEQRVRLDVAYVTGWSLWLDCGIIMKTLLCILLQKGAE